MYINTNYRIFMINQGLEKLVVNVFVNNIKIIELKNTKINVKIRIELIATFKIMDIRLINFCLGIKIDRNCQKQIIKLL